MGRSWIRLKEARIDRSSTLFHSYVDMCENSCAQLMDMQRKACITEPDLLLHTEDANSDQKHEAVTAEERSPPTCKTENGTFKGVHHGMEETRQLIQDIRRFSTRKCKLKQTSQLVKVGDELPVKMNYQSIIDDMDQSHPNW